MVGRWPSSAEGGVAVAVKCPAEKARAINRELRSGRMMNNTVKGFLVWEGEKPWGEDIYNFWIQDMVHANAFVDQLRKRGIRARAIRSKRECPCAGRAGA